MSYQDELQRLVEAKASMRQSIIDKGVDVPDDAKIEDYAGYILQIEGGGGFSPPDLSNPLTKEQLDNLQNIIEAGVASDYLELGNKLLVNYGSYVMPFEVVGFEDVVVEGGDTVHAINLLAQYTSETGSTWAPDSSVKYSASAIRTSCTTTYQNKLDANFVDCLAKTKVQTYSRDGSTDIVYDKLFAPSMSQLGVTNTSYTTAQQTNVEGPAFTAYEGAANAKRVKQGIDATSTAQLYYTRTWASTLTIYVGVITTSGGPDGSTYPTGRRVVVACNLIGK